MATYEYRCRECGISFDVYKPMELFDSKERCRACGGAAERVLRPPAGAKFSRDWNEKANDYQRDPYTQAKAQVTNAYNHAKDMGQDISMPTEAGIQVAAAEIAKGKRGPSVEQRAVAARRTKSR